MRPYSGSKLVDAERVFNYRWSRARRIIENTFVILVSRWGQILKKTLACSPENATSLTIVNAAICLHNFRMSRNEAQVPRRFRLICCPPDLIDNESEDHEVIEGLWRSTTGIGQLRPIGRLGANRAPQNASIQRNILRD